MINCLQIPLPGSIHFYTYSSIIHTWLFTSTTLKRILSRPSEYVLYCSSVTWLGWSQLFSKSICRPINNREIDKKYTSSTVLEQIHSHHLHQKLLVASCYIYEESFDWLIELKASLSFPLY